MEKSQNPQPTQSATTIEKLEKELVILEQEQKEERGSNPELVKKQIQREIEGVKAEIEQKKESSKEHGEKGVERVEKSGGEPEEVADAKKAGEVLKTKTEAAAEPAEMSATDLSEQAQAMEAEQKAETEKVVLNFGAFGPNGPVLDEPTTTEQVAGTATSKKQEKTQSGWEKTKGILADEQIQNQVAKTTAGTLASIVGVKSLYDVPAYLYQRFKVGGIFGHGKGLTGSVEELVTKAEDRTSFGERYALWGEAAKLEKDWILSADKEEKLAELKRKLTETEPRKVRDAIEELNTRLALTKEGEQKHSDQRKLIAKVLWERRTNEKMSMDEVRAKMDGILDDYTTTKVSGMQAVRESLNTALVASGALTLRGVSYAALDAVERKQRLDKEAKNQGLSLEERYQRLGDKDAKSVGKKATWGKDVFVGSIKETYQEAFAQGQEGKTTVQKSLNFIKAWGKIARYAGMGATVSFRPEAFVGDMDKVLDTLSGKTSFGDGVENFQGNIERTIDGYKNIANRINPFSSEGSSVEDKSAGGKGTEVESQEGKRLPMGERPVEIPVPAPDKVDGLSGLATVQKGKGISHAVLAQLSDTPEKFGFTGDVDDKIAVTTWAEKEMMEIITDGKYWDPKTGGGIGVAGQGGNVSYELERDSSGNFKINERLKDAEGNFVGKEINEITKNRGGARLETDRESYEFEMKPKEQATIPVAEAPVKEALTVPEPLGEATKEPTVSEQLDTYKERKLEMYKERIDLNAEPVLNMPKTLDYDQALSVAEKQTHNEISAILGSKGFLGFGVKDGMTSPDWTDRQVGFANATVENVMFPTTHTYGGDKDFGIKDSNPKVLKELQKLLTERFKETGIREKHGEKMGDYLTRTLMEKMGKGNALLTEVPIEPANIQEPEKGLPEERQKTDAEIKRDLKTWAREFDKDKDRFSRTETPTEVLPPAKDSVQEPLSTSGEYIKEEPKVTIKEIEIKEGMVSVEGTVEGSTGQEFLSKDYVPKLRRELTRENFDFNRALEQKANNASRNISLHLAAYQKLQREGKTDDAKKILEAIHRAVNRADETLGKGAIDRSKIPAIETVEIPEKTIEKLEAMPEVKAGAGELPKSELDKDLELIEKGLPKEQPEINKEWANGLKENSGTEARIAPVERIPEVTVENITTKTEVGNGNITETTGVTAEVRGSTGQEFLSKDYMLKLKPSVAGADFARTEAMMTSRSISARLAAYNELLSAGKTEEATKHLESLHKSVDMAEKSLGAGVIDRSKIPELK